MSQDRFFNSLSAGFGDGGAAGGGCTDEELLAYVEGELSPDRADSLSLRLLSDPVLFRQLEQMRINRSVLMSMPLEKAPADLLSRVQVAFEQQALVGTPLDEDLGPDLKLVSDGAAVGGMPRMDMHIVRTPWYQSRLAMAAGVLMLLSAGVYFGRGAFNTTPSPNPIDDGKTIADNTEKPVVPPKTETDPTPEPDKVALDTDPVLELADSGRPSQADLAAAISLPDHIISPEQAAALARDGRLAIRVATLRSDEAAAQVGKLTAIKPEAARSWRVGTDISNEVIETVASATLDAQPAMAKASRSGNPGSEQIVASGSLQEVARITQQWAPVQMPLSGPSINLPQARPARKPHGFVVEVDAASSSLAAVKGLLAQKTDAVATFIELPAPVNAGPATDPGDLMWFTQSPDNWVPRVRVPIVVGR